MKKMDKLLFPDNDGISTFAVFRGITAYFHNEDDTEKYFFAVMNGVVAKELNATIDYIFVGNDVSANTLAKYKSDLTSGNNGNRIEILKTDWISECFKKQKLCSIEKYIL